MKSLSESLFDSDLVSKQTDDMIRLAVQNQLQEIAKSNPEIEWSVVDNSDRSRSVRIGIDHTVYPTNSSICDKCSFSTIFEVVISEDLELYVYLTPIFFFVEGPSKLQRKYNNYSPLDVRIKPKPPYIKFPGRHEVEPVPMRDSRAMSFFYDDLRQLINNFYNPQTLSLMQRYTDTYMETDKRPTPIMNKIVDNVRKIYSKFNY